MAMTWGTSRWMTRQRGRVRFLLPLLALAGPLAAPAIEITHGPVVTNITEHTASVRWTTDLSATGSVRFGMTAGTLNTIVSNANLMQQHQVDLASLDSGTRYWYETISTTPDKSSVTSAPAWFETDSTSLVAYVSDAYFLGDAWKMAFAAAFSGTVKKVQFRLDDELVLTAYGDSFQAWAHPLAKFLAPDDFAGRHTATITAFDENNVSRVAAADLSFLEDCFQRNLRVEFNEPWRSTTLYTDAEALPADTFLPVNVSAYERGLVARTGRSRDFGPDWGTIGGELVPTNYPADHVDFYVGGVLVGSASDAVAGMPCQFETLVDCSGLSTGRHTLRAYGRMPQGCSGSGSIEIEVVRNMPDLRVHVAAVPVTNRFQVTLVVTNRGLEQAELLFLNHDAFGFQVCHATSSVPADLRNSYWVWTRSSRLSAEFPGGTTLAPGQSLTVSYIAVPIMYPDEHAYAFGNCFVSYEAQDDTYYDEFASASALTPDGLALDEAVFNACRTSNYLIVTAPANLAGMYGMEDTDRLLTKLAELAVVRAGVFGFYDSAAYFHGGFEAGDLVAFGDMFTDTGAEFFLGDLSDSRIRAYGSYKHLTVDDGSPRLPIWTPLGPGDELAAGQVLPRKWSGSPHAREELVYGRTETGDLTIYAYDWKTSHQMATQNLYVGFTEGCRLVVERCVSTGLASDIVMARPGNLIHFYDGETGTERTNFTIKFSAGDLIAGGNLIGVLRNQLVFGDVAGDELRVHHFPGPEAGATNPLARFTLDIEGGDALAAGDVRGNEQDEIVFVDESEDRVHIIVVEFRGTGWSLREVHSFDYPFYPGDRLAVARLFNQDKDKLCFIRGAHAGGEERRPGIDILTYLPGAEGPGDRVGLDGLINTGGEWAGRLKENWSHNGYLLLAGGADIIPAFADSFHVYSDVFKVDFTDMRFASTDGDGDIPELRVGRLVGETGDDLIVPIQTSLDIANGDVFLYRDNALLVHGHDKGVSGEDDDFDFSDWTDNLGDVLRDDAGFDYFNVRGTPDGYSQEEFCAGVGDGYIFLGGHGNVGMWDAFTAGYVMSNLEVAVYLRSVMYAASCLTGRYPAENSFAEACLRRGIAAYLGATVNALGDYCGMLAEEFARRLDEGTIGAAFRNARRDIADDGAAGSPRRARRYNASIQHLLGDPALEMIAPPGGGGAKAAKGEPPANEWDIMGPVSGVGLAVPAYTVRETNGLHHVRIPGGLRLAEPGLPVVPSYAVRILFPSGYTVQDVTLAGRSNSTQETGLNLPLGATNLWGRSGDGLAPLGNPGWWPDSDFEWTLTDMPDDAKLLRITAHPFFYESSSTTAVFYSNFTFSIDYVTTKVAVNRLVLNRTDLAAGDEVAVQLYVNNGGTAPSDITAEIRLLDMTRGTTAKVHSVTMDGLQGLGSYTYRWDSTDAEPGRYRAELVLYDGQAYVLDREILDFDIGGGGAEVADLTIAPSNFFVGDNVYISTCVTGTGSGASSGFVAIRAQDVNGGVLQTFQWEFNDLQAGQTECRNVMWSQAPVVARNCRFTAHVLADGQSSETRSDSTWQQADFWIGDVSDGVPGRLVQWWSLPGRNYQVSFASNLFDDFSCIASNLAATAPVSAYTDTAARAIGFYRVGEY